MRSLASTVSPTAACSSATTPSTGREDGGLHLHRFHREQLVALRDLRADRRVERGDEPGDRRGDLQRVAGVGLRARLGLRRDRLSVMNASRAMPFNSKLRVRRPSLSGAPTLTSRMKSVLPSSMSTVISSPGFRP